MLEGVGFHSSDKIPGLIPCISSYRVLRTGVEYALACSLVDPWSIRLGNRNLDSQWADSVESSFLCTLVESIRDVSHRY